jgi:type VI secretion system protein ImpM
MSKKTISYYGKLPSHGDFLSQQAPRAFTSVWDNWLQESMLTWRNRLPEGWVADYMTMKSYRFILSSGVAGEVIWCGILLPSRDKSGRLFPFTVCIPLSSEHISPIELFSSHHDWLEDLDQLTINCLKRDFNADKFRQYQKNLEVLAEQCPSIVPQSTNYSCKNTASTAQHTAFAWHSSLLNHSEEKTAITYPLLNALLGEYCHAHSIWWTKNNADFMLCQGLPSVDLTPALIDEKWNKWGWLCNETTKNKNELPEIPTKTSNDTEATQTFRIQR